MNSNTSPSRAARPVLQSLRLLSSKVIAFAVILLFACPTARSNGFDSWEAKGVGQFPSLFSGIAYGNGLYVAVGGNGQAATSTDSDIWTKQEMGVNALYRSVIFAEGRFLAVGRDTTIMESPDGAVWTPVSPTIYNLYGVAYGNGAYVAVGFTGRIYSSPDGKDWTERTSGTFSRLHSVTYGNELFVACGLSGTILTSPNGTTWTPRSTNTTEGLFGITFGNGTFVAIGADGSAVTSTNGIDWNLVSVTGGAGLHGVAWGNGMFIAVGRAVADGLGPHLWWSPDGTSWTRALTGTTRTLNTVVYATNRIVAAGEFGSIVRSGIVSAPPENLVNLLNVRWANHGVAFDFTSQIGSSYEVQHSPDLVNWLPEKTIVAESALTTYEEPFSTAPQRFLRVRRLP